MTQFKFRQTTLQYNTAVKKYTFGVKKRKKNQYKFIYHTGRNWFIQGP